MDVPVIKHVQIDDVQYVEKYVEAWSDLQYLSRVTRDFKVRWETCNSPDTELKHFRTCENNLENWPRHAPKKSPILLLNLWLCQG